MERFTKVSQILKLGNFPNFLRDLQNRLQDLEFTESHLSPKQDDSDTETTPSSNENETVDCAKEDQSLSSETISQAIVELKAIIDQVEHHPVLFSSKTKEALNPQVESGPDSDILDTVLSEEPESNLQTSDKSRPNTVASSVVAMTRTVSRGISTVTELLPFKGPWISSLVENHRSDQPKSVSAKDSDKQKHIENVEQIAHSNTGSTYEVSSRTMTYTNSNIMI